MAATICEGGVVCRDRYCPGRYLIRAVKAVKRNPEIKGVIDVAWNFICHMGRSISIPSRDRGSNEDWWNLMMVGG